MEKINQVKLDFILRNFLGREVSDLNEDEILELSRFLYVLKENNFITSEIYKNTMEAYIVKDKKTCKNCAYARGRFQNYVYCTYWSNRFSQQSEIPDIIEFCKRNISQETNYCLGSLIESEEDMYNVIEEIPPRLDRVFAYYNSKCNQFKTTNKSEDEI